jgi:hypothetical protein
MGLKMRSFGNQQMGRRSVPRAQAPLIALLVTAAAEHRADLVDVSRTGARLQGEMLPEVGVELTFRADDVEAYGEVVWRERNWCAVEFGTPIGGPEVQRLRSLAALALDTRNFEQA